MPISFNHSLICTPHIASIHAAYLYTSIRIILFKYKYVTIYTKVDSYNSSIVISFLCINHIHDQYTYVVTAYLNTDAVIVYDSKYPKLKGVEYAVLGSTFYMYHKNIHNA